MTQTRRAISGLRKSDRTRKAILDAALEFLWSRPFREMTVAELMSLSRASRPAFYQYFADLHELMEALLRGIEEEIFAVARPWFEGEGEPVQLLEESLAGFVSVCYRQGPIVRAVSDAAPMDERLEKAWTSFLNDFDDAVAARIEQQQAAGLIAPFDARPVAVALNRVDAALVIHHFGRRPRGNQKIVFDVMLRLWFSTLYGDKAFEKVGAETQGNAHTNKSAEL